MYHPAPHEKARRGVRQQAGVDAVTHELPRRQPRSLEQRPGFGGVHSIQSAVPPRRSDDAERRPVAAGCQRTGVAVRQRPAPPRDQLRAVTADHEVVLDVFPVNASRLTHQVCDDLFDGLRGWQTAEHPIHRAAQIGARRPCVPDLAGRIVQTVREVPVGRPCKLHRGQRQAVGARYADGGRAAHGHALDRQDHRAVVRCFDPHLFCGQLSLVQNPKRVPLPFKGSELCQSCRQFPCSNFYTNKKTSRRERSLSVVFLPLSSLERLGRSPELAPVSLRLRASTGCRASRGRSLRHSG